MFTDEKIYSVQDLIEILHISRPTLKELLKSGKLEYFRISNRIRVTETQLNTYIESTRNA